MRKHGAWYSKGFHGSAGFRRIINHAETAAQFEEAVGDFFMSGRDVEGSHVPAFSDVVPEP